MIFDVLLAKGPNLTLKKISGHQMHPILFQNIFCAKLGVKKWGVLQCLAAQYIEKIKIGHKFHQKSKARYVSYMHIQNQIIHVISSTKKMVSKVHQKARKYL